MHAQALRNEQKCVWMDLSRQQTLCKSLQKELVKEQQRTEVARQTSSLLRQKLKLAELASMATDQVLHILFQ